MQSPRDHPRLEAELRNSLKSFPLYREAHEVQVHSRDGKTTFSYTAGPKRYNHQDSDQTYFDFDIEGNVGFIFGFRIEDKEKRRKQGTTLNNLIEDFARSKGCTRMKANPSGKSSKLFREALGYKSEGEIVVVKPL